MVMPIWPDFLPVISSLTANMLDQTGHTAFAPAAPMRARMPSWNVAATAGMFADAIAFLVVRPM